METWEEYVFIALNHSLNKKHTSSTVNDRYCGDISNFDLIEIVEEIKKFILLLINKN